MGSSRQGSAPGRATIQGPRPAPLKGKKDSGGIRKQPPVPPPPTQRPSPLIIYVKSPKIIHTKARDFMALVQRLTGKSPTPPPPSSPSPSPPRWPSSSATAISAMPQASSPAYFASLTLDGTWTNLGTSQEMPLNVNAFLGDDDVVIDAKPYQMLPPGAILTATPSTPQNLHFSPYPNLLEISTPMILSASNSQEINPFVSAVPLQRPRASIPLINQTSASSSFDIDFTSLPKFCRH